MKSTLLSCAGITRRLQPGSSPCRFPAGARPDSGFATRIGGKGGCANEPVALVAARCRPAASQFAFGARPLWEPGRVLSLSVLLACFLLAGPAIAQVAPFFTVMRTSLVPIHQWTDPDPLPVVANGNFMATLARAKDGSMAFVGRVFSRQNGQQIGSALVLPLGAGSGPVDIMASTVFAPGNVLVLDAARRVHFFPIGFRADGSPFLSARTASIGPLGPTGAGAGTVLGEAPNAAQPDDPFLGIGTMNGEVVLTTPHIDPICNPVAPGPIQDLGGLRQVGSFVLGAVSGGRLHWLVPDGSPFPGLQPVVRGSFRDARSTPLIDFGAEILSRTSAPWSDPDPTPIVTSNGTKELATLVIPADLSFGSTLPVISVNTLATPIKQVIFSSLTATAADGSGIFYNRGFNFTEGLMGRLWTVAGATMTLDPQSVPVRGRSQWAAVRIEVENQGAAGIDLRTLVLSVDGAQGAVPGVARGLARLEDFDGDANVELEVPFQTAVLTRLLRQITGETALVRANWLFRDGTEGSASAEITIAP